MSCSKTGVTHFKTTIAGNRIVVALNVETAITQKHMEALIDHWRQKFKQPTEESVIKEKIRSTYPGCVFIDDLPNIPTAHKIL